MSKYIVIDNVNDRSDTFADKPRLVKFLNELVEEHDEDLVYNVEVYELGQKLNLEVKPRTVIVNEVKVTTKKK